MCSIVPLSFGVNATVTLDENYCLVIMREKSDDIQKLKIYYRKLKLGD